MKKREAQEAGLMFFKGNVCPRHPHLDGLRRAKSGGCPDCIRERQRVSRAKLGEEHKKTRRERNRAKRKAIKAGTWEPRAYRKAGEVKP